MSAIVFFEQYEVLHGGQQVLVELVHAALDCGCSATVLVPSGLCAEQCALAGALVRGIPLLSLRTGKKSLPDTLKLGAYTVVLLLRHWQTLRKADLLYVNGVRLLPVAWLASLLFRKQAVYHIHLDHTGFERCLFLLVLKHRLTRLLVVPSQFILRRLRRYSGRFDDTRCTVLENGLDARFTNIPYVDRFSDRPLCQVGIIGRVSREKGQDVVLDLAAAFPKMSFHILGDAAFDDGAYYAHLRETAPPNVRFHGWVNDVPAKARELDLQICLAPSRYAETFSLTLLQGAVLSCLTIARRVGAQTELAGQLGLRAFDQDEELPGIFRCALAATSESLAAETRSSYERVQSLYGHEAYRERLQGFFLRIMAEPEATHA